MSPAARVRVATFRISAPRVTERSCGAQVDYDGDSIGLEALREFAATIGPCSFSPDTWARCSEAQLEMIAELSQLTQAAMGS